MSEEINLAITGFHGTGSSAVLDILRGYRDVSITPADGRPYEHIAFYMAGGIFDTYTLLTHGNNSWRSDMTMNRFVNSMKLLNDNDLNWVGSYRKMFGSRFEKACNEFVESLSSARLGHSIKHLRYSRFSPIKAAAQLAAHVLVKRQISQYGVHYVYDKDPIRFALPTKEETLSASKRFVSSYFDLFRSACSDRVCVYDHLIWPSEIDEYQELFDESFKVIVLYRDPRDVYLANKYVWHVPPIGHGKPLLPVEPQAFVDLWRRTVVDDIQSKAVLKLQFEDLVYRYGETLGVIEDFLGLSRKDRMNEGLFIPEESKENTQLFHACPEWAEEVAFLEDTLTDYLYDFPEDYAPDRKKMFDLKQ